MNKGKKWTYMRLCVSCAGKLERAAEAAMVQMSLALDGIKNLSRELEERHLRTGGGKLEEKSEAD